MLQSPPGLPANLEGTAAIERRRRPLLTLIRTEQLSWSILHGPLALCSDSPRAVWLGAGWGWGGMRFFLQSEIHCSVRSRYTLPHWEMTPRCHPHTQQYLGRHFIDLLSHLLLRMIYLFIYFGECLVNSSF